MGAEMKDFLFRATVLWEQLKLDTVRPGMNKLKIEEIAEYVTDHRKQIIDDRPSLVHACTSAWTL